MLGMNRTRTALRGLFAGLLAACVMTLVMLALRLLAGIPLTFELGGDRVLPQLRYDDFLQLLRDLGGAIAAKQTAFLGTLAGQVAAGALLGGVYGLLTTHPRRQRRFVVAVVALSSIATIALFFPVLGANFAGIGPGWAAPLTAAGLVLAFAAYGLTLVAFDRALSASPPRAAELPAPATAVPAPTRIGRRQLVAGALGGGAALAAGGLTSLLHTRSALGYDGMGSPRGAGFAAITPNDRFYVVTKNIIDPHVTRSLWSLDISGEVRDPRSYDFDALAALPSSEREITLECISNRPGGTLIANAMWTGVPLRTLLETAGPKPGATHVLLRAVDGYTHGFELSRAMKPTAFVAYEMNGEPLPHRHGFPVRVLIPGGYGELSVKWIAQIEVLDGREDGYYESQGWMAGHVETTSRINEPAKNATLHAGSAIQISGIAFSGDRGIARVEVSADGGRHWRDASIDHARADTAWAVWSLRWRPSRAGAHELQVRATDGTGARQTERVRPTAPSGATGYHAITVRVA